MLFYSVINLKLNICNPCVRTINLFYIQYEMLARTQVHLKCQIFRLALPIQFFSRNMTNLIFYEQQILDALFLLLNLSTNNVLPQY